jgi:hypothetical protein
LIECENPDGQEPDQALFRSAIFPKV